MASKLGKGAVDAIAREEFGVLVGLISDKVKTTPYEKIIGKTKELNKELFELARILD